MSGGGAGELADLEAALGIAPAAPSGAPPEDGGETTPEKENETSLAWQAPGHLQPVPPPARADGDAAETPAELRTRGVSSVCVHERSHPPHTRIRLTLIPQSNAMDALVLTRFYAARRRMRWGCRS